MIPVTLLGQSGVRLQCGDAVIYIDPYLSDHVEELEGPELRRQVPIPVAPEQVRDATLVLVSHIHVDHCDTHTLAPLSRASAQARIVCPNECVPVLRAAGIDPRRLLVAPTDWLQVGPALRICAVPAAHTAVETDAEGLLRYVGYVIDHDGRRVYHAGDTSPDARLLEAVAARGPIAAAFLPVNECNYFRARRGIVGNMTLREAFRVAEELGVETLVPMHWDMFAPNSVFPEEIELLYRLLRPPFRMALRPSAV